MEELNKQQIVKYLLSYFTFFPFTKPLFINIGLTHRCNLRCKICETWKFGLKPENELKLPELKNLVNEIGRWGGINLRWRGVVEEKSFIGMYKARKKMEACNACNNKWAAYR
jgi:MoaA/NifB/PqqE/SkfB family radical SAM enzyme